MKVGVIDSGLGGLTVVKELIKLFPFLDIYYVGDTKRCPYGSRPEFEIREFTMQMISYLQKKKVELLIIACNTSTSLLFSELKNILTIPVIGVIEPGVKTALSFTTNNSIGIIATERTIESGSYEKSLKKVNPLVEVVGLSTPELVPLIEKGEWENEEIISYLTHKIAPKFQDRVDTLILGCTHYPLIAKQINQVFNHSLVLVDPAHQTVKEVYPYVEKLDQNKKGKCLCFVTGNQIEFEMKAKKWLNCDIFVEKIILK